MKAFKKYPSRIRKRFEERQNALRSSGSMAAREPAPPELLAELVDAIKINKTACFGVKKLCSLDLDSIFVLNEESPPCTLLSFSVMWKRDLITASLLRCGADPSRRPLASKASPEQEGVWFQDGDVVDVVSRFPLPYAVHVVNTIVGMRNNQQELQEETICGICSLPQVLSTWSGCGHSSCESCIWEYLLHVRTDVPFGCNVCGNSFTTCISSFALSPKAMADQLQHAAMNRSMSLQQWLSLSNEPDRSMAAGRSRPKRGTTKFRAMTLDELACANLGNIRSTRQSEFFKAVEMGSIRRVKALVAAGVDIEGRNEYGQTALLVACFYGHAEVAELLLLQAGASSAVADNAGATPKSICRSFLQHIFSRPVHYFHRSFSEELMRSLLTWLEQAPPDGAVPSEYRGATEMIYINEKYRVFPLIDNKVGNMNVTAFLSEETIGHVGTGSFILDDAFSHQYLSALLALHATLPAEPLCDISKSRRSYFFDSECWVGRGLILALCRIFSDLSGDKSAHMGEGGSVNAYLNSECPFYVMPTMRFLHYVEEGGHLPAHVDLSRKDASTGLESTHTFILYLTDCNEGGETVLLDSLQLPRTNCASDLSSSEPQFSNTKDLPLSEGEDIYRGRRPLSVVRPRVGRLLVFPHLCPHMGNTVRTTPKTLLRGELLLRNAMTPPHHRIDELN